MFPRVLLFLSTPSARRATRRCCSRRHCGQYFYPRPLRGGRPGERGNFQDAGDFYPRPLRGGRRGGLAAFNLQAAISIHALCEEGDASASNNCFGMKKFLSTPSARRATGGFGVGCRLQIISIHALCEEGDAVVRLSIPCDVLFLSTPSARRATGSCCSPPHSTGISIHALCEEGDEARGLPFPTSRISIHALCEEGDRCSGDGCRRQFLFLSTPSARRATGAGDALQLVCKISIHALREEGDLRFMI